MKTVTNTANITDEAGGAYKTTYSNTVTTYIRSPYDGGTGRECCELVCVCDAVVPVATVAVAAASIAAVAPTIAAVDTTTTECFIRAARSAR